MVTSCFRGSATFCRLAQAMQENMDTQQEQCLQCKRSFENSNFCTACGRQVNPIAQARSVCRVVEGSAEKAWKSFGFADARSPSKRARAVMTGCASVERTSTQALAATRSMIEKTVAPPTLEQARVIGVESMVEGVEWNLSTQQLQVLSLARSGALQGRRKVRRSSGAAIAAISNKTMPSKRWARMNKTRRGRVARSTFCSQSGKHSNGDAQAAARNSHRKIGGIRRGLAQKHSDDVLAKSQPAEASVSSERAIFFSPNETHAGGPNTLAMSSAHCRRRREPQATQEQIVALARGGVRHMGKVFHRKGVKLTADSPRSMLPRDAFRAPGPHLLGQEYLSIGQHENRRLFLAELSAIIRKCSSAGSVSKKGSRACGQSGVATFGSSRLGGFAGVHQADALCVCEGVRLEVRQLQFSRGALPDLDMIGLSASTTENPSDIGNIYPGEDKPAKIGASAHSCLSVFDGDDDAPSDGEGPGMHALRQRKREVDATHALESVPRATLSPTSIADRIEPLDNDRLAISADIVCLSNSGLLSFSRDLTHLEVCALVGPKLSWKDPFQENSGTVGELKDSSWTTCLQSLCGRLRVSAPALSGQGERTDDACTSTEAGKVKTAQAVATAGPETSERPQGMTRERFATTEGSPRLLQQRPPSTSLTEHDHKQQLQQHCEEKGVSANAAAKRQELQAENALAIRRVERSGCDQYDGRILRAIPMVRKGQDESAKEAEAGEHLWIDTAIMRVGVRVPWGRLHRGRYAKVLLTVRTGENGRGINFSALSISPTADPMLRGCWECKATDRDLARFLSSGSWDTATGSSRRGKPYSYDPHRCVDELQERGELLRACATIARKAFRLVLLVPGGVVLSLAGVAVAGGREVAWPQDIEEDKVLARASTDLQRSWRGLISRRHTRWLRMEREGRRRLSRLRNDIEAERERLRGLEQQAKDKVVLEERRRKRAQDIICRATRTWVRQEASRQQAEQAIRQTQVERGTDAEREEATKSAEATRSFLPTSDDTGRTDRVDSSDLADDDTCRIAASGGARLDSVVTIDGTEVHLTAHVQGVVNDDGVNGVVGTDTDDEPMGMVILAVDKKARRSSRLSLDAAEVAEIVDSRHRGGGGGDIYAAKTKGVHAALSAVLQKLTLFNSRRKDLFILSYRGKKVAAPH